MHFFWGGDMPHYSPPLPFWRAERGAHVCWPAGACAPLGGCGRARLLACPGPCHGSRPRTCVLAGRPAPVPAWAVARPLTHLAPNIGYVTIKPMTKYCQVFMLSLAGVQQDRNSGLACNYGAAIREKSVQ